MARIALDLARTLPGVVLRRRAEGARHPRWSTLYESIVDTMRTARKRIDRLPPAEQRRAWDALSAPTPLTSRVEVRADVVGGVRSTWVTPRARQEGAPTVLYLHGGGYAFGSFVTHRELVVRLALLSASRVLVPEYRLAPEHPFPAPVDDALAVYRALLDRVRAERIVVAGDSAGGGLAAALLIRLRDAGLPLPRGAALLSPWVDLASMGAHPERLRTDWLEPAWGAGHAERYLRGADASHPLASPLHGDLGGLPPLFVQVGDAEILFEQGTSLAEAARRAGTEVELDVEHGMVHSWQLFSGVDAGCRHAIERLARFVRTRTHGLGDAL